MEIKSYKDLLIWQKGISLVKEIYLLTETLPGDEKFGLISQLRRASVSIPSNIAEGYGRQSTGDYSRFLTYAVGSAYELDTLCRILVELELKAQKDINEITEEIESISKMTNSLIRKLKN